ncbi:MAG: hypothetical protein ACJ74O_09235 [Frankiaceae bacterium]
MSRCPPRSRQRAAAAGAAVHRRAIDEARRRKPGIALVRAAGMPVHDELEPELPLGPA